MKSDLDTARTFLPEIVEEAGKLLLDNLSRAKVLSSGESDIKIDTDLIVEELLISKISRVFPQHNVHSEERGKVTKGSRYTWVIDPIDGSYHYLRSLPLFAISVALKDEMSTLLSAVYNPLLNELFLAVADEGAWLNQDKIRVSETAEVKNALVLLDLPNMSAPKNIMHSSLELVGRFLQNAYRVRVLGVSSLSMCYVACGKVDAYVSLSPRTRIYDVSGGMFVLKMANGQTTDNTRHVKPSLVSSNGKIHDALLEIMGP